MRNLLHAAGLLGLGLAGALVWMLGRGEQPSQAVPEAAVAVSTSKQGTVVLRSIDLTATSKSGPPTVDVHGIELGIAKIKFVKE
jgi:hypothetical protein